MNLTSLCFLICLLVLGSCIRTEARASQTNGIFTSRLALITLIKKSSRPLAFTYNTSQELPSENLRTTAPYSYLELFSAIDTVDHLHLLIKLHFLGLQDSASTWLSSYLTQHFLCHLQLYLLLSSSHRGPPRFCHLTPSILYLHLLPGSANRLHSFQ